MVVSYEPTITIMMWPHVNVIYAVIWLDDPVPEIAGLGGFWCTFCQSKFLGESSEI